MRSKKKQSSKSKRKSIEVVKEKPLVKLDLACGQTPREGFEGVDFYAPNAKHKVDLFKFPFPWATASVDELHCSHFLEHLPCREVEARDIVDPQKPAGYRLGITGSPVPLNGRTGGEKIIGKDFLFAFMDECWRVLKPGGTMNIVVPSGTSTRAFQDPTHRRFFVGATFLYFNRDWRQQQKLDHYRAECHFAFNAVPIVEVGETVRTEEVQRQRFNELWNVIQDWQAVLTAMP